MNRESTVFVVEIEDGEWWYFLSDFVGHYGDIINDGETIDDYVISEWMAGYMLDNNSEWKDDDPDYYTPPFELWNWIREEIMWQRENKVADLESAKRVFEAMVAEYTKQPTK